MPEPTEPIKAGNVEPLVYEYRNIPPESDQHRSANYFIAKDIIENSIANSTGEGLSVYMVKIQISATEEFKAEEVWISLGQYLASGNLSRLVSNEEYKALLDEYNPQNEAYQELHKHDPNTNDSTTRNIGSTAILDNESVPRPPSDRFVDWKCAAANDHNVDENA